MRKHNSFGVRFRLWWTPVRIAGLMIGAFGLFISIFGTVYTGSFAHDLVQAFYANAGTECMSIAVTIIIIDWLHERRDAQHEKDRLAREMRNPDNGIALMAVEELRAEGWLDDDVLCGKYLWDANLEGVNLVGTRLHRTFFNRANLQRANLDKADLEGAHLERANLEDAHLDWANLDQSDLRLSRLRGAHLSHASLRLAHVHGADLTDARLDEAELTGAKIVDAELAKADQLRGATLPDGSRYDGRYNLAGDLAAARASTHDEPDSASIAAFYGISTDAYERGQAWAQEHLPALRGKG